MDDKDAKRTTPCKIGIRAMVVLAFTRYGDWRKRGGRADAVIRGALRGSVAATATVPSALAEDMVRNYNTGFGLMGWKQQHMF